MRRATGWLTVLVLMVGLPAARVAAGWGHRHECPGGSYSRWHFWAPTLYRIKAHFHGPTVPLHATDPYPGLPAGYQIYQYPCPPVPPPGQPYGLPPAPAAPKSDATAKEGKAPAAPQPAEPAKNGAAPGPRY